MKNFWRPYRSNKKKKKDIVKTTHSSLIDELSITNDEVAILAKRLEFFLPEFKTAIPLIPRALYIIGWSLFSTVILVPHYINSALGFTYNFLFELCLLSITILPAILLIDAYRSRLMTFTVFQACLRVFLIVLSTAIVAIGISLLGMLFLGVSFDKKSFALSVFSHVSIVAGFTIVILLYFISKYKELLALSTSFDLRLEAQNEIIKARMSPHFFFNTLNGLISVAESNPQRAVEMLNNIATLFRASLSSTEEISFDQEVDLCKVFLKIDEMRFHGKLNVYWDLPDEDDMYDMTITALTLQSVLEKIFYHIVEMTTETIDVRIKATWQHHVVKIDIDIDLPEKTLLIKHDLEFQMNFEVQAQRLKYFFGKASDIVSVINNNHINVNISYPLHDPTMSLNSVLN